MKGGALLLLLLGASSSAARANPVALAPLGGLAVEASEVRKVERRLRAALSRLSGFRLLPREWLAGPLRAPGNYDCRDRPECLGPLAARHGARQVISGNVGEIGGEYVVYLKLITRAGATLRSVSGVLASAEGAESRATRALLLQLLDPDRHCGALRIVVNVDDAWMYLDGRRVARGRAAFVPCVPVGTHALRITHEARQDDVRFVPIEFEQTSLVRAHLGAVLSHTKEMKLRRADAPMTDAELPWYRRVWAVAAFGALVTAAVATTVALLPRSIEADREVEVGVP